jgi:hypothetical protein
MSVDYHRLTLFWTNTFGQKRSEVKRESSHSTHGPTARRQRTKANMSLDVQRRSDMANRVPPTPQHANSASGLKTAACNVWRSGDADSMPAWDIHDPTPDAGYTTAGALPNGPQSIRLLPFRGSPYTRGYASLGGRCGDEPVTEGAWLNNKDKLAVLRCNPRDLR